MRSNLLDLIAILPLSRLYDEKILVFLQPRHGPGVQGELDVDAPTAFPARVQVDHAVELVVRAAADALRLSEAKINIVDLEPGRAAHRHAVHAGVAVVEQLRRRLVLLQSLLDRLRIVRLDHLL